jgi:hypothetical protein
MLRSERDGEDEEPHPGQWDKLDKKRAYLLIYMCAYVFLECFRCTSYVLLYLYDLFHILQSFWLTMDPGNVMKCNVMYVQHTQFSGAHIYDGGWHTVLLKPLPINLTIKGIQKLSTDQESECSIFPLMHWYTCTYAQVGSWLVYKHFVWICESVFVHVFLLNVWAF